MLISKKILKLNQADQGYKIVDKALVEKKQDKEIAPVVQASEIGFTLALPITLGALFGLWLDNKFNSQPKFVLAGIFLGLFLSFSNLFWIVKKYSNKKEKT